MVLYKCDKCNKIFGRKSNFNGHLKRKNPCKLSILNHTETIPKEYSKKEHDDRKQEVIYTEHIHTSKKCCAYCQKVFSQKSALNRHIKSNCKIKRHDDNEKETIFKQLLDEIKEIKKVNDANQRKISEITNENHTLREQIMKIHNKSTKNINSHNNTQTNTQNNTVNGNVNTFVLVGCGKEDISKIDKTEIMQAIKAGFHAPIRLTDTVHFNPKYPECHAVQLDSLRLFAEQRHNVYISNMKDKFETLCFKFVEKLNNFSNKYGMIYDGTNWNLTTKTELVDKLYDNNKSYVEENLDDFCGSLTKSQRAALDRIFDNLSKNRPNNKIQEFYCLSDGWIQKMIHQKLWM